MQYRTEILYNVDDLLSKEWMDLWERAENANVYNSYEWFLTYIETMKLKSYEIHVCYRDNKLVALLPLQSYRCFGVNVFGTFDKDHLVDTSFLMEKYDKTIFKHFFGSILQKKNIYLQKIDDRAATLLYKLFPDMLISLMSVNPCVPLTGDPYATVSQSTLLRLKKIIKKNEGQIHFETYTSNLQKYLDTMLKIQENSSKKARSIDIFEREANKKYYQNLIKFCQKFVRINILFHNKLPIAYELGLEYRKSYLGDQISYHNDYKNYVPGKMIVYYLISALKKRGITVLDQGGGISSYKMSFTNEYRLLYNVYYSRNVFVMMWWKLINKVRRMKQVNFPKEHTRDHEFLFKTI